MKNIATENPTGDSIIGAVKVKIKDWDFIMSHTSPVNPVPDMEPYCGKEVTVIECIVPAVSENMPGIYTIFEDNGKFWWSQEWFENII